MNCIKTKNQRDENKLEVDHAVPYIKQLPNVSTAAVFLQAHSCNETKSPPLKPRDIRSNETESGTKKPLPTQASLSTSYVLLKKERVFLQ
jgi:hypothetical protein